MKTTVLVILVTFAIFQNWDRLGRVFHKAEPIKEGDVVLYATSWCGYCKLTRQYLAQNNIPYTEYDIETSGEGRHRYNQLNKTGVPVLDIKGTIVAGYKPDDIRTALEQ